MESKVAKIEPHLFVSFSQSETVIQTFKHVYLHQN